MWHKQQYDTGILGPPQISSNVRLHVNNGFKKSNAGYHVAIHLRFDPISTIACHRTTLKAKIFWWTMDIQRYQIVWHQDGMQIVTKKKWDFYGRANTAISTDTQQFCKTRLMICLRIVQSVWLYNIILGIWSIHIGLISNKLNWLFK